MFMGLEELIQNSEELPSLSGTVEDIIYRNAVNEYAVIAFLADDGTATTAVGCLPDVRKGETLVLFGDWVYHPSYGQQFQVENFQRTLPTETNEILKYLSSGVIRGVGPVTALKIVNRFGADAFDVIEHHPTWLADVPGITRKKAAEINQQFCSQNGLRKLMMCCREYLGPSAITRVYKAWGDRSITVIEENPYRLCDEIYGIGFEKADSIAQKLGVVTDSEYRITSGLRYVLINAANTDGHACLPREDLVTATATRLNLPRERIDEVLSTLTKRRHLIELLLENKPYIFTSENDKAEEYVSKKLWELAGSSEVMSDRDIARMIAITEAERDMHFAQLQCVAIREALSNGVMILTGGPGTGKTTVVRALLRMFDQMRIKTLLAAPTGRAAKRMSEATGEEARTIHRMLEMEKSDSGEFHFNRNQNNPLEAKAIIIDEASMIDLPLMEGLLRATLRGTRLIFIGDDNQLPPVGCGNVLRDMIESGSFKTVCLTEIFRQSAESMIITNAHRINNGELPLLHVKNDDSFFLARASDEQILDTLVSLVTVRLPRAYGQEIQEELQIITPSRKGTAGTENLNKILKEHMNPPHPDKKEIKFRDTVFREGDKVMQIRNNYDIEWRKGEFVGSGVFNGDIGYITLIDLSSEQVQIRFEDRVAIYDFSTLEEIEHAYAITVHKSQGSEYGVVLFPLYHFAPVLRTRNLFYTALTRAKKMVIMVGAESVAQNMVDNNVRAMRHTALAHRLQRLQNNP